MIELKRLWWVSSNEEKLIVVLNVASDDKNYKTHKSATQQKISSSNAVWFVKIINKKYTEEKQHLFRKIKTQNSSKSISKSSA